MKKTLIFLSVVFAFLVSCQPEVALEGVRISPESLEFLEGAQAKKIYLYLYPNHTTETDVRWVSDPEGIVEVSEDGMVTPLTPGTAEISAVYGDKRFGNCKVTVLPFIHVTSISLDKETLSCPLGSTAQLTATLLPEDCSNPGLTWSSSDETVVKVSSAGEIETIAKGKAVITATAVDGGLTAQCDVEVTYKYVTGLTISPDKITINLGGASKQLEAVIEPADASNPAVIWTSLDESVVTVDKNGIISAVSVGTADVRVTSVENDKLTAICTVTVAKEQTLGPNLVKNPGFENPNDAATDVIAADWYQVPEDWFIEYYGQTKVEFPAKASRSNGEFFISGNGKDVKDILTGEYAGRLPAAGTSGLYQLIDVNPGSEYSYSINIVIKKVNNNQSIKNNESLKILSEDGMTLYSFVPMPDASKDKQKQTLTGSVTIPDGVNQVRIQLDSRDAGKAPNRAPLILFDECTFCELQ